MTKTTDEMIESIIKALKTRGWESPDEVDEYFEKSLNEVAEVAYKEGYEDAKRAKKAINYVKRVAGDVIKQLSKED